MNATTINPRQQNFVFNILLGMNYTDAYMDAYSLTKRTCSAVGANKLLKNRKVALVLKEELSNRHEEIHQKQKEIMNQVGETKEGLKTLTIMKNKTFSQHQKLSNMSEKSETLTYPNNREPETSVIKPPHQPNPYPKPPEQPPIIRK